VINLTGIFGYFSQNINKNVVNEIVSAMKDEDYCITDQILNRSCVLGKLDIKSTEVKELITISKTKANKIPNMLIKRNIFLDKGKNYIDYDDLIRRNKEYRNYIRSMIDKVEEREYFNRGYIEEIWRLHMQGKKNYSMLFGLLVTFELFLEGFVDD
jgi:hypothetical protein